MQSIASSDANPDNHFVRTKNPYLHVNRLILLVCLNLYSSIYGHVETLPLNTLWAIPVVKQVRLAGPGLNPRPHAPKASALPLHQRGIGKQIKGKILLYYRFYWDVFY